MPWFIQQLQSLRSSSITLPCGWPTRPPRRHDTARSTCDNDHCDGWRNNVRTLRTRRAKHQRQLNTINRLAAASRTLSVLVYRAAKHSAATSQMRAVERQFTSQFRPSSRARSAQFYACSLERVWYLYVVGCDTIRATQGKHNEHR